MHTDTHGTVATSPLCIVVKGADLHGFESWMAVIGCRRVVECLSIESLGKLFIVIFKERVMGDDELQNAIAAYYSQMRR